MQSLFFVCLFFSLPRLTAVLKLLDLTAHVPEGPARRAAVIQTRANGSKSFLISADSGLQKAVR